MYEAGTHRTEHGQDQLFFALEYVEGAEDILEWSRGQDLETRLARFLDVCDAVQHGHQNGVVHRDLKPANVLVSADGNVKVIDFGVARALDAESEATRATLPGEIVGTLYHMAPEQLEGDSDRVDTRADVYALGLLLYQLACDRLPYDVRGRPMTEVVRLIREASPVPLAKVDPSLPTDLGWIALRALEKEPERRYASASELAADLRRLLADLPVEARPPSRVYALRKFVRRNRWSVAASTLFVAAVLVGGIVSFVAMVRAGTEAGRFRSINDVLRGMFVSVRAEERGHDARVADLLDDAASEVDGIADPALRAPLRSTLARSYHSPRPARAGDRRRANRAPGASIPHARRGDRPRLRPGDEPDHPRAVRREP